MGESDEQNNLEGRIRRLEAKLDDFVGLFEDPQELSSNHKEDWYRGVIQKTRRLVDDYRYDQLLALCEAKGRSS